MLVANGIFVRISQAFVNVSTIIPAFLSHLTSSNFVIGIITSAGQIGWYLPQFFVASQIEHLSTKKWLYVLMSYFRIAIFAIITVLVFTSDIISSAFIILLFVLAYIIYTIAGGIAGIPFLHIVSDTISKERRGLLWSYRMLIGGILAALAGFSIKYFLKAMSFPGNYGTLFLISTVFLTIGLSLFNFTGEYETEKREKPGSLRLYIMESRKMLGKDKNYKKMMIWRAFLSIWSMSIPFYAIFALKKLSISEDNIGFLFSAQMAGTVLMNLLWGYVSDKFGNKKVLIYNSLSAVAIPLIPFIALYFKSLSFVIISATFFLLGSLLGGTWIGYINYIIELSPKKKRDTYLGFLNTFAGFTFLLVPLGGLLADIFSLNTLFVVSIISGAIMFTYSFTLRDLRN